MAIHHALGVEDEVPEPWMGEHPSWRAASEHGKALIQSGAYSFTRLAIIRVETRHHGYVRKDG